jgi:hypothetical protein
MKIFNMLGTWAKRGKKTESYVFPLAIFDQNPHICCTHARHVKYVHLEVRYSGLLGLDSSRKAQGEISAIVSFVSGMSWSIVVHVKAGKAKLKHPNLTLRLP